MELIFNESEAIFALNSKEHYEVDNYGRKIVLTEPWEHKTNSYSYELVEDTSGFYVNLNKNGSREIIAKFPSSTGQIHLYFWDRVIVPFANGYRTET